MLRTLRAFWQDQRGIALILVSIMLPAIIGFSLLVIDMSRASTLHNDLQKAADAFALAGAAELDGSTDAITRADRAIQTLVENQYYFSGSGATPPRTLAAAGITRRYLKSLPTTVGGVVGDARPIAAADVITNEVDDAKLARFVEVRANPVGFSAIFPVSVVSAAGGPQTFNVGATAVAGFTSSVCDYTPVFICNPYELTERTGGTTLEQAASTQTLRRHQIKLRGDGFYGPGNFAFLKSPEGNGANELERTLAGVKPSSCYSREGVDTEPGQNAGPVMDGLNARFGLTAAYVGAYGPAANVRMGIKNVECKNGAVKQFDWETVKANGTGMPRDGCFATGTCTSINPSDTSGPALGNGVWDVSTDYWDINHKLATGAPKPLPTGITSTSTRYEIYRAETADPALISDASLSGETGVPACGMTPNTTVDRRILYGAILDCQALSDIGINLSGRREGIPVRAFGSFFITEPIKDGKDIFVELVDITGRGGRGTLDNFLRDEAQLYR